MTQQSPFGEGGFDVNALLQQAQQMQEQMAEAQQELAAATVEGTVADGLVTVTVNGAGELVGLKIRKDSFDPSDTEDLEDLVVAAYRDARAKADEMVSERLNPLTGGLGGDLGGMLGGSAGGEPGPGGAPGQLGL